MLFTLNKEKITDIPHKREYNLWRSRLSEEDHEKIKEELKKELDRAVKDGKGMRTSSHVPGSDWRGKPYQAIYEKACDRNERHSAFFFGLLMWKAVMDHEKSWTFIKRDDIAKGMTYFILKREGATHAAVA